MARKKKTSKRRITRRRSSRMSGIGGTLANAAFQVAGAVAAKFVSNYAVKMLPSTMSTMTKGLIANAAPIAVGLYFPKLLKGAAGVNIGTGMIVAGGLGLVQSTGVLAGVGNVYANMPVKNIAGYQGASAGTYIAGIRNSAIMEAC